IWTLLTWERGWSHVSEATGEVWDAVASNPKPNEDLGYDLQPLNVITVGEANEQCMVLPSNSNHLENDEFMVADPSSICDLHEHR
ncbi:hypothetical protein, partial [Halorubrum lacusprofundi]|uniref:hypothetical protein n=1 Tax=Halorubrum lacusprofundi TaxID=2247 RepID=UPI001A8C07E6